MSSRIVKITTLVFSLFEMTFVGPAEAGEFLEVSMGVDGLRRSSHGCILKSRGNSIGAAYLRDPAGEDRWMIGFNTSLLALGHLSDAGLAAEVRNPGPEALGRATERTFYRADLRSVSSSRFGIAVMPWDSRRGAAWERRDGLNAGLVWMTPITTDHIEWELLGEAIHIEESRTDDAWYPDEPGRAAGSLGIAATRWRFHSRDWSLALSFLSSGGSAWRPGGLVSLSTDIAAGPWSVRSRSVYATPFFRDADGDRPDFQAATSIRCRRRPNHGLRLCAEYEAGQRYCYPVGGLFVDEGVFSIGWKFRRLRLDAVTDWNRLASKRPLVEDEYAFRRASFSAIWDDGRFSIREDLSMDAQAAWQASTCLGVSGIGPMTVVLKCRIHSNKEILLWDLGFQSRFRFGSQTVEVSLDTEDLPRDWVAGRPSGAGDFNLEIRWKTGIRRLTEN